MSASARTEGFSANSETMGSLERIVRFPDVGEWLKGAPEVVGRREQGLGDVGARAGGDRDASPARTVVDEPGRARRPFALDHDL